MIFKRTFLFFLFFLSRKIEQPSRRIARIATGSILIFPRLLFFIFWNVNLFTYFFFFFFFFFFCFLGCCI